ncbi:aldolase superfamily protein [Tanacetum coccineum]
MNGSNMRVENGAIQIVDTSRYVKEDVRLISIEMQILKTATKFEKNVKLQYQQKRVSSNGCNSLANLIETAKSICVPGKRILVVDGVKSCAYKRRAFCDFCYPRSLRVPERSYPNCAQVTERTLATCYKAFNDYHVLLEATLLRVRMVRPGSGLQKVPPEVVAEYTVRALQRTMPTSVPSVVIKKRKRAHST